MITLFCTLVKTQCTYVYLCCQGKVRTYRYSKPNLRYKLKLRVRATISVATLKIYGTPCFSDGKTTCKQHERVVYVENLIYK